MSFLRPRSLTPSIPGPVRWVLVVASIALALTLLCSSSFGGAASVSLGLRTSSVAPAGLAAANTSGSSPSITSNEANASAHGNSSGITYNASTDSFCLSTCGSALVAPPVQSSAGVGPADGARAEARPADTVHGAAWSGATYWWDNEYQGGSNTGSLAFTSMKVPSSAPVSGDQYVALLSEVDSNGYYDEIGLASDYGCSACGNPYDTWSVAAEEGYGSSSAACGALTNYVTHDGYDSSGLNPGGWYTFGLYLTGSNLVFKVWSGEGSMNGTPVWSLSVSNSASAFEIATTASCKGTTTAALSNTLYLGVMSVVNAMDVPQWSWAFVDTDWATYSGGWTFNGVPDSDYEFFDQATSGYTPPVPAQGYYMEYSEHADQVTVADEATWMEYGTNTLTVSPGGSGYTTGQAVSIGLGDSFDTFDLAMRQWHDYCLNTTCDAKISCTVPTGFGGSYNSISSVPTTNLYYQVNVPSGQSSGWYYGGCTLTITSPISEFTTFEFYIDVT
jgi:hypothetical protein